MYAVFGRVRCLYVFKIKKNTCIADINEMGGIVYFIFKIFLFCEGEKKAFYGDIKKGDNFRTSRSPSL
jgi:hypothetical protein